MGKSDELLIEGLIQKKADIKAQISLLTDGLRHIDGVISMLSNDTAPTRKPKNQIFQHNECKIMILDILRNAAGSPLSLDDIANELIRIKCIDTTELNLINFKKGLKISIGRLVGHGVVQCDSMGRWFVMV